MLGDYWYYFKFHIAEWIHGEKNKRKKQSHLFQKCAILMACVLWAVTGARLLWNSTGNGITGSQSGGKVISAFSSTGYKNLEASISAYGKYGDITLTDGAKKVVLDQIAESIGIHHYAVNQGVEDEKQVMTLSQGSSNGDVIVKFITIDGEIPEQYVYVGLTLNQTIDAAFTYKRKVENIMKNMEINTTVTLNLKGTLQGEMTPSQKKALTEQLLTGIGAKTVAQHTTENQDDIYTTYAYDRSLDSYVMAGSSKVNVNVAITYDEKQNQTNVYFSTPIQNQDY